jgi:Zn-finger nucleic acid-binding protein
MNQTMTATSAFPRRVHTKIVGITFEGRQEILAECKRQDVSVLHLVPDPTNRYDSLAVGIEADIIDGSGAATTVRLGYVSNSDHVCSDCGAIVGNSMFQNSKTARCPECETLYNLGANIPEHTICPACNTTVETAISKVVICPRCGGVDFGRGGLATRILRAITAGVTYRATVMEYTGGEPGPGGKIKTMGCNILLEIDQSNGGGGNGHNP